MTNSAEPDDINTRLDEIDTSLEELGDELDLLRTVQTANRRETRSNSQTIARLERTIRELGNIARLHQQGLSASHEQAERDRQIFQAEIRRIWEYLLGQQPGNGRGEG